MYTGFLLGEMKEWDDGWGYRMLTFYIIRKYILEGLRGISRVPHPLNKILQEILHTHVGKINTVCLWIS